MRNYATRSCLFTLLLLLVLGVWPKTSPAVESDSYTLDNGLKVIFLHRPGIGVLSGRLAFRLGSGEEKGDEYGFAHLLEHMLFKSTSRRSSGESTRLVENRGGIINAYTSPCNTAYTIEIPSDQLETMIDVFADMIINPLFKPDELADEQEVIVEEIKMNLDDPESVLYDLFALRLFGPDHPYGRPVLGNATSVRSATQDSLRAFYQRNYRPNNAALILAGDFDAKAAKECIARYFAAWKDPGLPARQPRDLPRKTGATVEIVTDPNTEMTRAYIGFPGFPGANPDFIATDVFATAMRGLTGRIEKKVKYEAKLVTSINVENMNLVDDGYFVVTFQTDAEKLVPAATAILAELEQILERPLTQEETQRGKICLKAEYLADWDSTRHIANDLVTYEAICGDWRLGRDQFALIDALAADDLNRAARQHFLGQKPCIVAMVPESERDALPGYVTELEKAAKNFSPAVPAGQQAETTPRFEEVPFLEGIRLWVMRDPSRDVVSVDAGVRGGLFAETRKDNGIHSMLASVWGKATKSKNSREFAMEKESLGVGIGGYSGNFIIGLAAGGIRDNWREGLRLFAEAFTQPDFADDDVELVRREHLADISQRDDYLDSRVTHLAYEARFGDHPLALEVTGQEETVRTFTPADLFDIYRREVLSGEVVIAVAGDVDPREVREILLQGFDDGWRQGAGLSPVRFPPPAPQLDKTAFASRILDRQQTHLAILFPAPAIDSPDRAAAVVLRGHLDGMSGPLFMELRVKRSLAYSVYPTSVSTLDHGALKLSIACDPDKLQPALDGMRTVVEDLLAKGLTEEEVADAKLLILGEKRIQNQTLSSRTDKAVNYALAGMGVNSEEEYMARMEAVSVDDVNRVAKKYLDFNRAAIATLGPNADAMKWK